MPELQGRKEGSGGQAVHVDTQGTSTFFAVSDLPRGLWLPGWYVTLGLRWNEGAQGARLGHGAGLALSHADTVAPSPPTGCPGESPQSPETEVVPESRKHWPKSNFLKQSCFHTDRQVNHDAHAEEEGF